VGAVLLPLLGRSLGQGKASILAYTLFAAATTILALTSSVLAALMLWALWELASTTAVTNGITIHQQLTPDDMQGRVNTTGRMIAWGGTPFGALLGGWVAQAYGVRAAYLLLAIPVVVGAAALLASPVRGLRRQAAHARSGSSPSSC
jgi:predicted MFS family arabinose efflux permease